MKKFRNKGLIVFVCVVVLCAFVVTLQADKKDDKYKRLNDKLKKLGYRFTVGKTPVSDIPLEYLCGLKKPKNWAKLGKFDGVTESTRALPSAFDWRDQGKVSPVKNQGSCGSCWAFGNIASYEGAIAVNGGPIEDLSEQFLLDCNTHGYSCSGGWWCFDNLYNGVPKESCYPYVAYQQSCQTGCTKYYPEDSWYYVGTQYTVPSTSALKQAIYDHGPLAVAVNATSAFQSYTGGIFDYCQTGSINHAVCLVGWDDSGGYWILKNSWGTGWGESGFMRITYGCNQIGYNAAYGIPSGSTPPPPDDPYEPNDTYSAAYGPITSGQNYADGEISTTSDVDWFKFSITSTGTISVSVSHESGADLDWYLYHSSDTSNYLARGYTTNNPETGSYSATTTGTYYVKVVGYNGSTSSYTLNVSYPTGGGGGTYYRIMSRYSGYALDINSGSSYVYHYAWNGGTDKQWTITLVSGEWYKIENRANGYALDVGTSGNYVYNYVYNGATDKHWSFTDVGGGYYRIDNRYSGYSLDVGSGSYVYQYTYNGNTDKHWQLISVE